MSLEKISANHSFGGWHQQFQHASTTLNCTMRFAIFLPPQAQQAPVPVVYWLSGLTCTDENFMQKAGAQRIAAQLGIAIVAPDTSPRGADVANDEGYDLGQGAGFYVNASQEPWRAHYQMYDYISQELPQLIESHFPVTQQRALSGHSMGGHGALMIALRNPKRYSSVTAYSPISNPIYCPWGQKAFSAYLGDDEEAWKPYDSCELIRHADHKVPALVDQGNDDQFLTEQLKPEALLHAARENDYPLSLRYQAGYDHSYYFIASFIEEHLGFHWRYFK